MDNDAYIPVGQFPAIQRDLFLSRAVRRTEDVPLAVETLRVEWDDYIVSFATNESVSGCTVEVKPGISIVTFTRRIESLLDCGSKSEGSEWTLKWSDRISRFGIAEKVRCLLCDKIASIDSVTGETIGVLKIKRRSVNSGYAKLRLVPSEDVLQVVCRHTSSQGLKAVWKSVSYRLKPQFPEKKEQAVDSTNGTNDISTLGGQSLDIQGSQYGYILEEPCIKIVCSYSNWRDYTPVVARLGAEVDVKFASEKGMDLSLPLDSNHFNGFGSWESVRRTAGKRWEWEKDSYHPDYKIVFRVKKVPKGEIPSAVSLNSDGTVSFSHTHYVTFRIRVLEIAQWLQIDLDLAEAPKDSNNSMPEIPPE